ncbi:MAG: EF-hand domain-containing protein [Planctomycetota bacterium]|jgi:hypothetical protein
MSSRVVRFGVVVAWAGVLAAWGCSRGPTRVKPPGIDADAAGEQALQQYDTNKDGFIAGAELDKAPALKASMKNLDTNSDGKVSAEEITARIETWQRDKVGKTSLMVTVRRMGRPLPGATVRFVPEKFLGKEVLTAVGETLDDGTADRSVPDDPEYPNLPGVHCGLFRVEISKKVNGKETIPAIYNTQTILGQEVSNDAEGVREGIRYDLR